MPSTLSKSERLCRTSYIDKLFEKGNPKLNGFPFRFSWVYLEHDGNFPVQVIFVVPKKSFPKANKRNRVKRLLRELYRLNKNELYETLTLKQRKIILSISYSNPNILPFAQLEKPYVQLLQKLKHELEKSN